MITKKIIVTNKTGLHARPASEFVKLSKTFESDVQICFKDRKLNGKSLLSIMTGALVEGSEIDICASGADEEKCIRDLTDFVVNLKD